MLLYYSVTLPVSRNVSEIGPFPPITMPFISGLGSCQTCHMSFYTCIGHRGDTSQKSGTDIFFIGIGIQ